MMFSFRSPGIVPDFRVPISRESEEQLEKKAYAINENLGDFVKVLNIVGRPRRPREVLNENVALTFLNVIDSGVMGPLREVFADEVTDVSSGDHLFVQRLGYTHHALYYGQGNVIHYSGDYIVMDSIKAFSGGEKILKKNWLESPASYSPTEIIERARLRLGENRYNVIFNNCEHFVRWCRCGEKLER